MNLHDLLFDEFKGTSIGGPYDISWFRGAVFHNRIPQTFAGFVDAEVRQLVDRGVSPGGRTAVPPGGPLRPRFMMALSVATTKPRLIYDAKPLNKQCNRVHWSMDTVARVAHVVSTGCHMTSFDDASAFHHIIVHPAAWSLCGFSYGGIDDYWCVLPFGLSLSPWYYHTLSEARATYLCSKGIITLA